jgi:hypothetical protein
MERLSTALPLPTYLLGWTIHEVTVPIAGSPYQVNALTDDGLIGGWYLSQGKQLGFFWDAGSGPADYKYPVLGIAKRPDVLFVYDPGTKRFGVVDAGHFTALAHPPGIATYVPKHIARSGVVYGEGIAAGKWFVIAWDTPSKPRLVDLPTGYEGDFQFRDTNISGGLVGECLDEVNNQFIPMFVKASRIDILDLKGLRPSTNNPREGCATGINDHDQIVGFAGGPLVDLSDPSVPYIVDGGKVKKLRIPKAHAVPVDINNEGHIVGQYFYGSPGQEEERAFWYDRNSSAFVDLSSLRQVTAAGWSSLNRVNQQSSSFTSGYGTIGSATKTFLLHRT